ncbi:MAG TPA: prolipoprotein diacylglyceryl transferase [Bacillaceae bacterium]|nr:prolipoprotein diacylglyceryl transferase [Bacillaceae bacterium]
MPHHPPLSPVAVQLGPIAVRWYGLLIGLGALLGFFVAAREGKRRYGLPVDVFLDLLLYGVPVAVIFARLYYVAFTWDYYRLHPEDILAVWKGGLAIHGALLGAFLVGWWYARRMRLDFLGLLDLAAPSLILGQAIGRWGNFFNQEAHGGPVSRSFLESLHLPNWMIEQMYIGGTYVHPTFLYESIWDFLGFLVLLGLRRFNLPRGSIVFSYLIWYSVGRFYIEGLRTDSLMLSPTLRAAQVVSLLLVATGVLGLVWAALRRPSVRYADPLVLPGSPLLSEGQENGDERREASDTRRGEADTPPSATREEHDARDTKGDAE